VRKVARKVVGESMVLDPTPTMAAEDFAFYLQQRPGCFFFVGSAPRPNEETPHHKSNFDLDERSLAIGSSIFVNLILEILGKDYH